MELNILTAISPIDGRYRSKTEKLSRYFSEYALIKYRVKVEIEYFITLCEIPLPQLKNFDKTLFNTEKGIESFLTLVKTYFENGGQQVSVNVLDREELLDAQIHPERHRNLIVRVGGYSDYFTSLPPALQKNVIDRTTFNL